MSGHQKQRRTIRRRLLVSVNATLGVLLAVFLAYEYQRSIDARLAEKHASLQDEAATVTESVVVLRHHGRDAIQHYIDAVCRRMQEPSSPGHHLIVELNGTILQAEAHQRASEEIVAAMKSAADAPNHQASFGGRELVVGNDRRENVRVYVAEFADDIRRSVLADVLRHLIALGLGGFIAAIIVNLVLYRTVDKPLRRLANTVTKIGKGNLGLQSRSFKTVELACLADAINSMSTSLAAAQRERKAQLKKAREIQENLLPHGTEIPGIQLTTLYRPADEVSGDYFDFFRLPDDSWLACIADVVGHGIPAAMTAAMLKVLLLEATGKHTDPSIILASVNERLLEVALTDDFASMCLARWCPPEGRLQYSSAGHGSIHLLSRDGISQALPSTGLLLGIDARATWETVDLRVRCGDRLVLATDGVSETSNASRELFGDERLADLLSETRDLSLVDQVRRIERALGAHRAGETQQDDVTLILIEFAPERLATVASGEKKVVD